MREREGDWVRGTGPLLRVLQNSSYLAETTFVAHFYAYKHIIVTRAACVALVSSVLVQWCVWGWGWGSGA